jgi:hypothetical protein
MHPFFKKNTISCDVDDKEDFPIAAHLHSTHKEEFHSGPSAQYHRTTMYEMRKDLSS